jgi:LPS-assembly protein
MRRLVAAMVAVPGFVPSIAHAQLAGDAAAPQRLDAPWGLRLSPQLEEHPVPPGSAASTFVLGDQTNGTADRDIAAKGAAEVRRNTSVFKADAMHYDQDTDFVDAYGSVRIINNGVLFAGPEAHLQVESTQGTMPQPKYHFNVTGGSGSGSRAVLFDSERARLYDATYTTCQCQSNPAWYIRASRFDFDTGEDEGVARNGVVFFQGVPLFGSPWLSFPLSDARRSGLLPPLLSQSTTSGVEFALPYYFNIAPNRDLMITPRLMTKRGVLTQSVFRYLSPSYSGTFTGEYLPRDALKKERRYAIYWQHDQNLGNGFAAYVRYNRVSDDTYPEDLAGASNQFLTGTQLLYQQEAGVTYNNGPWSVLAREQHWQILQGSTPPYAREPQLNVKYTKYNVGGFDFGTEADYSRFRITTADATEGDRVMFNPYVSYGIIGPGYFVVPKAQLHFASYDLIHVGSDAPTGQPKRFTESIPTFSVDSGLIFDRSIRLFGDDYIQTLEPRVYYVYTPYRNQDAAPLFDTAEADFGMAEFFQPNTFVGNDRIADANRVTTALTTRFINAANGDERARFMFGQQYYFRDQRVTLTPGASTSAASHSDLIAGASLKLGASFASESAFQYNPDSSQLVRASVGFGYSPEDRKVLNIGYRYTRTTPTFNYKSGNQVLISGQWPITHRVFAVARFNYDFTSHRVVDAIAGFQYDAVCWVLGFGAQRFANGLDTTGAPRTDTRWLAQLTLKGFANVDNGLVASFRAGVNGYSPPPPAAPPLARYSDYE